MPISLREIAGDETVFSGHGHTKADLVSAQADVLASGGYTAGQITFIQNNTRYFESYYDDTVGFTHCCDNHTAEEALGTCYGADLVTVCRVDVNIEPNIEVV